MDPLSQGVVGAVCAQTGSRPSDLMKAAVIGAVSGMMADLDVLIDAPADPLSALEYHRQFTHSLLFAPIGGLLCSGLFYLSIGKRWSLHYRQILLWCILGFASHGLLDACTSYGTQLLWPVSEQRFSWNIISIVDPLFTLPLLGLVVYAAVRRRKRAIGWALVWAGVYLASGYWQQSRVQTLAQQLAQQRGHTIERLVVKPGFANIIVWKIIYQTSDEFHVAAVKPGWFETATIWPGTSIGKLDVERDFPWLDADSQQARDIQRFAVLSDGYLAKVATDDQRIADIRYSMLPTEIKPLWGIELSKDAAVDQHVGFYTARGDSRAAMQQLIKMMTD